MANLPIGFAALIGGGILTAAAITGASLPDVAKGKATTPKNLGGQTSTGDGEASGAADSTSSAAPSTTTAGTVTFDGKQVAAWIAPALTYARANGWAGTVTSGYRSLAEQQRIYQSGVRPAAIPGTSNHESDAFPGGAVDVTDASQLSAILLKSPFATLLVWAGSKDPVHFSHPHNGSY